MPIDAEHPPFSTRNNRNESLRRYPLLPKITPPHPHKDDPWRTRSLLQ